VSVGENGGADIYDINGKGGVAWVGNGARSFITAFMTREGDPKQCASIGPLSCIANSNGNQSELEMVAPDALVCPPRGTLSRGAPRL
jgi:hypothetical protein